MVTRSGSGDLFCSGAEAVVNPVNTVGVMGAGLALQFKKRFPDNFEAYKKVCLVGALGIGNVFCFDNGVGSTPRWILNVPTKTHYNRPSTIPYIRAGATALATELTTRSIGSVAIPALGCGLGGLDWAEVRPILVDALEPVLTICTIYDPT